MQQGEGEGEEAVWGGKDLCVLCVCVCEKGGWRGEGVRGEEGVGVRKHECTHAHQ